MAFMITSFFTRGGQPATNIETVTPGFPVVRVWEVTDGSATGDGFVGEFQMIPIEDGANDDGFYKYELTAVDGYDETKSYIFRCFGGPSLPPHEQWQTGEKAAEVGDITTTEINQIAQAAASAVWDVPAADHVTAGTFGESANQVRANTANIMNQLYLDADSVLEVVQLLLKLETGRTKIDPVTSTLTVYDNDCTTVLRQFNLLDSNGVASVSEICERKPTIKGPSDTTTLTGTC